VSLLLALTPAPLALIAATQPMHQPLPYADVDYRGELWTRYAAATCNLLTRPDRYSIDTFRSNATCTPGALWIDWPGDQLGRFLTALHGAEGHGWTPAAAFRSAIGDVVLPAQTENGNFGVPLPPDSRDGRVPSGNAFALRGLMDAYDDTGEQRYLDAARRLARYFEAAAPTWGSKPGEMLHEFYGHCIDGLVRLHELGGDDWALELAKGLASHAGRTGHTHHSLSLYRGIIELCLATGETDLLSRAEDYLAWCAECRTVSGALPEAMPASEQDEGCGLADYVVVNLLAFCATGRDAYIQDAERTLVNQFFMNQFHTGGFGHRGFGQEIVGGKVWQGWEGQFGSENPGCCSIWGQWALGELGRFIVTESGEAVEVNLYPQAGVSLPKRRIRLEIGSDFPQMSRATVTVHCDRPTHFPLSLRIPAWAETATASGDGVRGRHAKPGERLVIDREWHSGDSVELRFGVEPRLVPWPSRAAGTAGVFAGPLCLALSSADANVDELDRVRVDAAGRPIRDAAGRVMAEDATGTRHAALAPLERDWLSPDVKDPHRLRILFRPTGR